MEPPIVFMHIAKTAGSYLNAVFASALGKERCIFHAEASVGLQRNLAANLNDGVRLFSGHIYLGQWKSMFQDIGISPIWMTALRDPVEHISSHILWLDHYNQAQFQSEYRALSLPLRRLVDQIGATDLSHPGQLDFLLTNLSPVGVQHLDNCQSRYFICQGNDPKKFTPLTLADAPDLRNSLAFFDLVFRQDRLGSDVQSAAALTKLPLRPLEGRINGARASRRIDIENPIIRNVLGKRVLLDQWLWRVVSGAVGVQKAKSGGTVDTAIF